MEEHVIELYRLNIKGLSLGNNTADVINFFTPLLESVQIIRGCRDSSCIQMF